MPSGGSFPEENEDKLSRYADLVREWAPRMNLVSLGDLDRFEERHVSDSLRIAELVRDMPPGPGVDVGSGAGLPGIPLAIEDPDRPWRLLEPRRKRASFLEEVVRSLELTNCEVVPLSAQEAASQERFAEAHILATARALAGPKEAIDLLRPLLRSDGIVIVFVSSGTDLPPGAVEIEPGIASMAL